MQMHQLALGFPMYAKMAIQLSGAQKFALKKLLLVPQK